ncbi:MAG TPA: Hsp20/alpha crystallin family protein [Candidatus Brocadiaceae bacterium]
MEKKEYPPVEKKKITPDKCVATGRGDWYFPLSDIYETPDNFMIVIDMPGVATENITIDMQNNELVINGEVSLESYSDEKVIYNEYNIGHYHRHFVLSDAINREKIEAKMADGVLTLVLPKAMSVKPRRIEVSAE